MYVCDICYISQSVECGGVCSLLTELAPSSTVSGEETDPPGKALCTSPVPIYQL